MNEIKVGSARVSTLEQDLTVQREALARLGVDEANILVDHGMTGTNRARPGLREALAAVRRGDTLVVTELDRLAGSLAQLRVRGHVGRMRDASCRRNCDGRGRDRHSSRDRRARSRSPRERTLSRPVNHRLSSGALDTVIPRVQLVGPY